jgi:ferredoxin
MIANYGYEDASGNYFITIDTNKCNGCGDCVRACSQAVMGLMDDDYGRNVATIREVHRKKLKYSCATCKSPTGDRSMPCIVACGTGAITHSW